MEYQISTLEVKPRLNHPRSTRPKKDENNNRQKKRKENDRTERTGLLNPFCGRRATGWSWSVPPWRLGFQRVCRARVCLRGEDEQLSCIWAGPFHLYFGFYWAFHDLHNCSFRNFFIFNFFY